MLEPDPNSGNSLTLQTSYAYTVLNQKQTVAQGVQTRSYSYDGMGRLTSDSRCGARLREGQPPAALAPARPPGSGSEPRVRVGAVPGRPECLTLVSDPLPQLAPDECDTGLRSGQIEYEARGT
jgi:hypothetical protein